MEHFGYLTPHETSEAIYPLHGPGSPHQLPRLSASAALAASRDSDTVGHGSPLL